MAIRTALLNGNVINRDADFSKYIETVSEPGVIEGLAVSTTIVAVGKARVPCERDNGEKLYALVTVSTPASISGEGDVFIKVNQSYIDDGELANDDGTGIATIEVGTMPSKNALKLATISSGVATDARNMIKKVGELYTYIATLQGQVGSIEQQIDFLVNDSASSLKESGIVGEKYTLADDIFRQKTPEYDNCTTDYSIGDINKNQEIHIQRIGSGTATNKLYLKIKSVGSPTTGLTVEVREGTLIDLDTEAYWYGKDADLIATGNISYSSITSDYQMFEIETDEDFGGIRGQLLNIVVYQTGGIVNANNYYKIACDSSQYSEGFSFVSKGGINRERSNLCPYCIGDGLLDNMLCKTKTAGSAENHTIANSTTRTGTNTESYTTTQTYSTLYIVMDFTCDSTYVGDSSSDVSGVGTNDGSITVTVGGTTVISQTISRLQSDSNGNQMVKLSNVQSGTTITFSITNPGYFTQSYPGLSRYFIHSVNGSIVLSPNQKTIIRPLKPIELKSIGQQTYGISFGRLDDGSWLGEFDGEVHDSATTGSITLGNCVGFKVITDANGEKYKIPIYGM